MQTAPKTLQAALGVVALIIGVFAVLTAIRVAAYDEPTPEMIVKAFEDRGLEVGDYYSVEQEESWEESSVPDVYTGGVRFEIPSIGKNAGGRVFTFESYDEARLMFEYYESLGKMPGSGPKLESHLYAEGYLGGHALLQISGKLSKTEAERYGQVLEDEV